MAKDWTKQGIRDSAKGKADKIKGRVKDAAGGLTGDTKLQVEGKIDRLKGSAKDTMGKLERDLGRDSE